MNSSFLFSFLPSILSLPRTASTWTWQRLSSLVFTCVPRSFSCSDRYYVLCTVPVFVLTISLICTVWLTHLHPHNFLSTILSFLLDRFLALTMWMTFCPLDNTRPLVVVSESLREQGIFVADFLWPARLNATSGDPEHVVATSGDPEHVVATSGDPTTCIRTVCTWTFAVFFFLALRLEPGLGDVSSAPHHHCCTQHPGCKPSRHSHQLSAAWIDPRGNLVVSWQRQTSLDDPFADCQPGNCQLTESVLLPTCPASG